MNICVGKLKIHKMKKEPIQNCIGRVERRYI